MHLFTFTKAELIDLYLDYANNFISLERFTAWHNANNHKATYELPIAFYESCINRGRTLHNGAVYEWCTTPNRHGRANDMLLKECSA